MGKVKKLECKLQAPDDPIFGEISCAALGSSSSARQLLAGLQHGTAEIWKSVAPDNHLGSFIELVGGAGNSATITLPDGLYVMFWDHPMHVSIGAERNKK